jgi:serine phosphatase RsbU (regulator of sigma subunit)/HAMP domain-containing protein
LGYEAVALRKEIMIRTSLKLEFSVLASLLLMGVISLVSIFALSHEKQSLIEERLLRGKSAARNLATASAEAILSDNELNLFSYCKDIVTNEADALEVSVITADSVLIAHSRPEMVGKKWTGENYNSQQITARSIEKDNGKIISIVSPMNVLDKKLGYVNIIMSDESIRKKIDGLRKDIIKLSFIAISIGIFLTIILAHYLVVPIKKLMIGTSVIGAGDFAHRITIKSRNEIGELANKFNSMAASLLRSKEQIASLNETSRAINTTIEKDDVFKKAMDAISVIIQPEQAIICLHDNGNLQIAETYGFDPGINLKGLIIKLSESQILEVIEKRFVVMKQMPSIPCEGHLKRIDLQTYSNGEMVIVPLAYKQSLKGFVLVSGKKDGKKFLRTDQEYLEIIASSSAIAILNIELLVDTAEKARMQSELEMAETVQKTLFPDEPVVSDSVDVYGYFQSASETGGDWYYTLMDKFTNSLFVFIGDVTGHGVPAALNTATAYSFVKTIHLIRQNINSIITKIPNLNHADSLISKHIYGMLNPAYVLQLLNTILMKKSERPFLMTFFSSLIDCSTMKIYYANAGHEMPLVYRANNQELEPLVSSGVRLGDTPRVSFEQKCIQLYPGDTIFWYTDGIIEAVDNNGNEYGSRRFYRTIKKAGAQASAKDAIDYCINDLKSFVKECPLNDDVTLVVAKIKARQGAV